MDRFSAKTRSSPKNNQVLSSRGRGRDGFSRRTRERLTPHAPRLDEQPYGITTRTGCSPCPHLDLGHHSPTSWPVSLHQRHQHLNNLRSPRTLADLPHLPLPHWETWPPSKGPPTTQLPQQHRPRRTKLLGTRQASAKHQQQCCNYRCKA